MRIVGLFTGIGGLELGLSQAGHHTILFSEIAAPAKAVLKSRIPEIPVQSDVTKLRDLPARVDLLTAGFPCQDLSQAGNTAGIRGKSSSLVEEVFRLLDRRRVPWVLLENVSFMLHLGSGLALSRIVDALEERGYCWAYRVVNSLAFLPQRRERVFILASREADPSDVLFSDEVQPPTSKTSLHSHAHGFYWTEGIRGLGWAPDCVPTLKNGSTLGIPSPPAILMPDGRVIKPDIRDAERLQGFEADWTKPAEEVSRTTQRWSLVGNAVTVPVARWLGKCLTAPGSYDKSRDADIDTSKRWPRAARFDGRVRRRVEISAFPTWNERLPLHEFLSFPGVLLSAKATRGFLDRTKRGSLRFAEGFLTRVRRHLAAVEARSESTVSITEAGAFLPAE